jgi:hypothetical protein
MSMRLKMMRRRPGRGGGAPPGPPYDPGYTPRVANLELWVDALNPAHGYAEADDFNVWPDQGGKGNNLNGTASAVAPVYRDGTTVEGMNGKACARIAAAGECFFEELSYVLSAAGADAASGAELFIVMELDSNTPPIQNRGICWEGNPDFDDAYPYSDGNIYLMWACEPQVAAGAPGIALNEPHILNLVSHGAYYDVRLNGVDKYHRGSNTVSFSSSGAFPRFGKSETTEQFRGLFGEILSYSSEITAPERATIVAGLKTKWGIT